MKEEPQCTRELVNESSCGCNYLIWSHFSLLIFFFDGLCFGALDLLIVLVD